MAKGYWISRYSSTDAEASKKYGEAVGPVMQKYGGKPVIRNGQYETVEGAETTNNVVVEFDSYEQARACYHSPEYQAAMAHIKNAFSRDLIIIEGFDG